MASNKLSAAILVISLLFFSTLSSACKTCGSYWKPPPPPLESCPLNTLKLGVCVDLLGLINLQLGSPPSSECCALISGLADLEAALCLCTAIKANVLGINLNVPITLSLLLSACQKSIPDGFKCQ